MEPDDLSDLMYELRELRGSIDALHDRLGELFNLKTGSAPVRSTRKKRASRPPKREPEPKTEADIDRDPPTGPHF